MMVDRDADRDGGVQVYAQDLGYRAELLFQLGFKPDGVAETTAVVIQIGLLALFGSTRLLRSTCAVRYGDRTLRGLILGAPDRVVGRVGGTVQRRGCDTLQEV